jgi:hypothetical protein
MSACFKSEQAKSQSGYGFTKGLALRAEPKSRLTPSGRIGQNAYFGFEKRLGPPLDRLTFIFHWLASRNDDI